MSVPAEALVILGPCQALLADQNLGSGGALLPALGCSGSGGAALLLTSVSEHSYGTWGWKTKSGEMQISWATISSFNKALGEELG